MKSYLFSFFFMLIVLASLGQESSDTLRKDALRVYTISNEDEWDSDFIKQEIPFINYMRDLKDAQVYIILTSQQTGSGGTEYTYVFSGQQEFEGLNDTVTFSVSPDETYDEVRQREVSTLKMALMRYLVRTPFARYFNIDFSAPAEEEVTTDKWRNWIFELKLYGYIEGQKTYNSNTYNGTFSINKITEQWKLDFSIDYGNVIDNYEYEDETYRYTKEEKSITALMVKSLGEHWGIGLSTSVSQSTYSNYDLRVLAMPSIEFNVFPYSQSTRKLMTFNYSAGYFFQDYTEVTIYDKTVDRLWGHSLDAIYTVIQKWGNLYIGVEWRNYFREWKLKDFQDFNNLSFYTSLDFRIAKGLSISVSGGTTMVHDQLNLAKGGATKEEVLLRRKEVETQYYYYSIIGVSYTFGSIYNNVVNPRFRNGGAAKRIID